MAAPTYDVDLTILDDAADSTGWAEPTASGWTSLFAITSAETDLFIQGGTCNSATFKTGVGGMLFDAGASGVTIPTDGAFLIWAYWAAPNSLANEANGGIRTMIGSALNAFYGFIHGGSDTYTYGGWLNLATGDPSAVTPDYTEGSPTSTRRYFGWGVNATTVPSKGNPFVVDICYYGRCEARFSDGDSGTPATFAGFATLNDNSSYRYGLIQAISGGYLWKGLMTLGYGGAVYFADSNKTILIENTKKVTANFNKIEINNTGSEVYWTAISFQALGTVSKGRFEMVDNATVEIDACSFTDMDTFVFLSNGVITDTIFRRCGQITAGGATFSGCTISNSTAATNVLCASPAEAALISDSEFISDGTGHAIEIGGTAANFTLTNVNFTGYAASDGSTGNEAIYVNIASGSLNLTVSGGTVPSIRTAGCSVTVVTSSRTVKVKTQDAGGAAIGSAQVFLKAIAGGVFPAGASVTIVNSGTTATVTHTGHGLATNDQVLIEGASLDANNGVFTITVTGTDTYTYTMGSTPGSSPTGTITSTFVFLYGLTNGTTGEISMSRSMPGAQPVSGNARKYGGTPKYKTGPISGSVSASENTTFQAVMVED